MNYEVIYEKSPLVYLLLNIKTFIQQPNAKFKKAVDLRQENGQRKSINFFINPYRALA